MSSTVHRAYLKTGPEVQVGLLPRESGAPHGVVLEEDLHGTCQDIRQYKVENVSHTPERMHWGTRRPLNLTWRGAYFSSDNADKLRPLGQEHVPAAQRRRCFMKSDSESGDRPRARYSCTYLERKPASCRYMDVRKSSVTENDNDNDEHPHRPRVSHTERKGGKRGRCGVIGRAVSGGENMCQPQSSCDGVPDP